MGKRFAIVGVLLGLTWPTTALAQFSTIDTTDATAGTAVDTNVAGTGHPGRFAVGITNHGRSAARNIASIVPVTGGFGIRFSRLSIGSVSAKYFLTDRIAGQLLLSFGHLTGTYYPEPFDDRDNNVEGKGFVLTAGPHLLYSVLRGDNAELYVGAGLDILYEDANNDPSGPNNADGWTALAYVVSVPVGFEIGFPGMPQVRFSAEVALSLVSATYEAHRDRGADPEREEIGSVTAIILGSPGLDFITLGIHYYF